MRRTAQGAALFITATTTMETKARGAKRVSSWGVEGGICICLLQVQPDCLGFGLEIGAMIGHVGFGSGRPRNTSSCMLPIECQTSKKCRAPYPYAADGESSSSSFLGCLGALYFTDAVATER